MRRGRCSVPGLWVVVMCLLAGGSAAVAADVPAVFWNDAERAWITFGPRPDNAMMVELDTARLAAGRWTLKAGQQPPPDCPVLGVKLQRIVKGRPVISDTGWTLTLAVVAVRQHGAGKVPFYTVQGRVTLAFPGVRLDGSFTARPIIDIR